uniref:L1 transposable element RRM domain-containing protein n=1 Tax=Knipowitschia caucasica TaxID=637954 RepID=A0AAV2JVH5_KNICA
MRRMLHDDVQEMRRMTDGVQEEIRKVGADVLAVKEGMDILTTKLVKLESRVTEAEDRVSHLEDDNNLLTDQVQSLIKTVNQLQTRVEYHENYSRRNNLRLRGVPEDQGNGQNEMECVQAILKNLFKDTEQSTEDILIERAHRVPTGPRRDQRDALPRYIVVRFLRFTDREKVRNRARSIGKFHWKDAQIDFFPDFTREVQEKRRSFNDVKRACAEKELSYSMQYPAVL